MLKNLCSSSSAPIRIVLHLLLLTVQFPLFPEGEIVGWRGIKRKNNEKGIKIDRKILNVGCEEKNV
jgi:hypothetical protein